MKPRSPASRQLVSTGVLCRKAPPSICLTRKSATSARERDEAACPAARIDQRAIGVRLRPIGQDHGTHDHPLELAPADDPFLHVLVVSHDPPDGISTGRQIEYATVEEEYAARMTFVQKAPAVRISRGVFPVQRLNACVNALTS